MAFLFIPPKGGEGLCHSDPRGRLAGTGRSLQAGILRLGLGILLLWVLAPAVAAADVSPRGAHQQTIHHADASLPTELARSAGSAEVIAGAEGRTRDLTGRTPDGRLSPSHPPFPRFFDLATGILASPAVPPAPSTAESLPYYATAPPVGA